MKKDAFKTVTIKPLVGLLDTRGNPDEVDVGSWRWFESWECSDKGKLCRMSGYQHALADEYSNNADLHDQLLTLAGEGHVREPIIFLREVKMANGANKLFAGTKSRLYALNNASGNWVVISDQLSGGDYWWIAPSEDIVVFSNGSDRPVYHVIDQPPTGTGNQSVAVIPDLEKLKITAAGFVTQWAGLTFYCNVIQDGVRASYRILWSDYQKPLSVVPKASVSLAGFKDLDFGEVILNAAEVGNTLLIYTNLGIWQCTLSGSESVLTFSKRYAAQRPGMRCLHYPRTLISTGAEHYYVSGDGIYLFSLYVPAPERVEFIHKGDGKMFEDLDKANCGVHCAGYETNKKQLFFSYARTGETLPQNCLVINTEFNFCSYVPFGATAFANFGPNLQYTLRQFVLDKCICTSAGLLAEDIGYVKEGPLCVPVADPTCDTPPTSFYTNDSIDLDGVAIEDYTNPEPDEDSLCSLLGGLTVADLCNAESLANECRGVDKFLFAASVDSCIKQTNPDVYYRELCSGFTGCGSYTRLGYRSPIRSGPLNFGLGDRVKYITRMDVVAWPALQSVPSQITLRIGTSAEADDPNDPRCAILWQTFAPKNLECQNNLTAAQATDRKVRPDETLSWPAYFNGQMIYFEIDIINPLGTVVDSGGSVCLSSFAFRVGLGP